MMEEKIVFERDGAICDTPRIMAFAEALGEELENAVRELICKRAEDLFREYMEDELLESEIADLTEAVLDCTSFRQDELRDNVIPDCLDAAGIVSCTFESELEEEK